MRGGGGGVLGGQHQWVQLYTGAQINCGDLTPYLTYAPPFSPFKRTVSRNFWFLHDQTISTPEYLCVIVKTFKLLFIDDVSTLHVLYNTLQYIHRNIYKYLFLNYTPSYVYRYEEADVQSNPIVTLIVFYYSCSVE